VSLVGKRHLFDTRTQYVCPAFSASLSHFLGESFGTDDWWRILKFRSSRFQRLHHRFEVEFILIHCAGRADTGLSDQDGRCR